MNSTLGTPLDLAEHGGERHDPFPGLVAKQVYRPSRALIDGITHAQVAKIGAYPGYAKQAVFVVHNC